MSNQTLFAKCAQKTCVQDPLVTDSEGGEIRWEHKIPRPKQQSSVHFVMANILMKENIQSNHTEYICVFIVPKNSKFPKLLLG